MDAGRIIGTAVAGAALISGLVIGAGKLYEKALDFFTPEPAIKLPKMILPEESDEEG